MWKRYNIESIHETLQILQKLQQLIITDNRLSNPQAATFKEDVTRFFLEIGCNPRPVCEVWANNKDQAL